LRSVEPIRWMKEGVVLLDQRRLPTEVVHITYTDYRELAQAIKDMVIRGAPAIGVTAAMGIALGVLNSHARTLEELRAEFKTICETFARTRPTAVDLFWAIERFKKKFESLANDVKVSKENHLSHIREQLVEEALAVHRERKAADEAIGKFGAELMPQSGRVMTQCNAGALATGGIGTALGVIRVAVETGHTLEVFVPETRPYLQGARLTAWELHEDKIPLTLITDNMVGHFLRSGGVGAIVVGADRIAANGDTANKIGTYPMAVLANEHHVPFYVAAPISTLDLSISSGEKIPIEQRAASEVTHVHGVRMAPDVNVANPAFDVTPARLIAAIITERGVARAPYEESLGKIVRGA
jgi:methylthioribose-1-phosphate isomerase